MKLSQALEKIGSANTGSVKTASATPALSPKAAAASSDVAAETLSAALKEATAVEPAAKTASASSPVADITKLAADIASSEHEALVKEAQLYGASVCDGFMVRLAQYNDAAVKLAPQASGTKIASASANEIGDFEKFAYENPDLVKEAHDLGYASTVSDLEKLAEAAYTKGYNETVEQIYKTACDSFVEGFSQTLKLLENAR